MFEVKVTDGCNDAGFSASSGAAQSYYIGTAAGTYEVPSFNINTTASACSVTYAVQISSNSG